MKRILFLGLTVVLLLGLNSTNLFAQADPTPAWVLGDWDININGTTYNLYPSGTPVSLPSSVITTPASYPTTLGSPLGSFNFTISNPGANYVGVYLQPYYDYGLGDVSDAFASVSGFAPTDVSYQLGWPGVDGVWDHFAANTLDGSNTVGAYSPPPNACCTVSIAELFGFSLNAGETATVKFNLSAVAPTSGFYIQLKDGQWNESIYLTESSSITSVTAPESIPGFLLLFVCGASMFWAMRMKLRREA